MYNMLVAARKLDDSIHQIKVATTQLQLLRVYQQVVFFLYTITAYTCDHDQIDIYTVEPVYNGHLGTRYIWPLYTGGCYRENLYKVVSSILVAMAVINE